MGMFGSRPCFGRSRRLHMKMPRSQQQQPPSCSLQSAVCRSWGPPPLLAGLPGVSGDLTAPRAFFRVLSHSGAAFGGGLPCVRHDWPTAHVFPSPRPSPSMMAACPATSGRGVAWPGARRQTTTAVELGCFGTSRRASAVLRRPSIHQHGACSTSFPSPSRFNRRAHAPGGLDEPSRARCKACVRCRGCMTSQARYFL
jgi:hypothetical protein